MRLANQKVEMEKEMARKQNWAQNRLIELRAEEQAVEKAVEFHSDEEEFKMKAMEALKEAQTSKAAAILSWKGCELDLTSSVIDKMSSLTLSENIFAEMLHQTEKGENVVMEIENGLAECAAKREEPAIEVEDDEPGASGIKRSQEMPPPISAPKPNKAPVQLEKPAVKVWLCLRCRRKKSAATMKEKEKTRSSAISQRVWRLWIEKKSQKSCCMSRSDSSSGTFWEETVAKDC